MNEQTGLKDHPLLLLLLFFLLIVTTLSCVQRGEGEGPLKKEKEMMISYLDLLK